MSSAGEDEHALVGTPPSAVVISAAVAAYVVFIIEIPSLTPEQAG